MFSAFISFVRPLFVFTAILGLVPAPHASTQQPGPWKPLFDGHSLAGWKEVGPGSFTVENGLLVSGGGMGLLYWTGGPIGDCDLRVVFRMRHQNDNSGVFIRIPSEPPEPWFAVNKGYEVQIDNNDDLFHRTGVLYSFTKALASPCKPGRAWNTMVIRLAGPRTVVTVNGVLVTDFTEGASFQPPARQHAWEPAAGARPESGWIGLQNHSAKDIVEFKEVSIRSLA